MLIIITEMGMRFGLYIQEQAQLIVVKTALAIGETLNASLFDGSLKPRSSNHSHYVCDSPHISQDEYFSYTNSFVLASIEKFSKFTVSRHL